MSSGDAMKAAELALASQAGAPYVKVSAETLRSLLDGLEEARYRMRELCDSSKIMAEDYRRVRDKYVDMKERHDALLAKIDGED